MMQGDIKKREGVEKGRSAFKKVFELVVFSLLLALLIAPGLFYTDVIAHEFYHYLKHQDVAEEICIDLNKPYLGHVKIRFDSEDQLLKYESEQQSKEEKNADLFGHVASAIYLVNALVVVHWMLWLVTRRNRGQ
ncbi:MAG: hypothetical protein Q8N77_04800 [Nanoarchaeota archaeon]|nr:hypothetical protein [Nanoarchaeota archaeon]